MQKLTKTKANTLLEHAKFMRACNRNMRLGQALVKLLQLSYPSLYEIIRTTEYDPFYSDDLIEKCLTQITEKV